MMFYCLAFIVLWSTPGYTTPPSSSKAHSSDEIDHVHIVYNKITELHLSEKCSDVVLNFGIEKFHAHRILLALRSGFFRDLFYGDDKTNDSEVEISAELPLFKILLQYIYTGQLPSSILKGKDNIFKFFDMSDTFKVSHLQSERPKKNMRFNDPINHVQLLMSDIKSLHETKMFSDVVFVLGEERLEAHRFLLASHSEIFRVLLYGGHKETDERDVVINDVSITLFEILLSYFYTGHYDLSALGDADIFELHKISDFYNVIKLKHKLHKYLQKSINLGNVCSFLDATRLYELKELEEQSIDLIENNALEVLYRDNFLNLSPGALEDILNRDTFYANELEIFHAVCRWIKNNQKELDRDTKIKVLSAVRYSLMNDEDRSKARESQLISSDIISEAIQLRNSLTQDKPQFRGQLKPNVNLDYEQRELPRYYVSGIKSLELEKPSKINFLQITLWHISNDPNLRIAYDFSKLYSYYVEVSINGLDWMRVIDHSNYNCRSFQHLWFPPQIVRYIRFIGTHSSANESFVLWDISYNAKYMHMFENNNGLVVPKENVVSSLYYAIVIEGENSVNGKSLLDKYEENYSRHDIYTYHKVESGSIVVHLVQPFMLSSMRMLLGGDDNQFYSYTVEVSVNKLHWNMIVDKSNEPTRSWQLFQFKVMTILYIRITGKYSSADNIFRCVYLEAPAQVQLESDVVQDERAKKKKTDDTMTASSSGNPVV